MRIYHADARTPSATRLRDYGPVARFDPHRPASPAGVDPDGRAVVYLAEQIDTSVCESIGRQGRYPGICPQWMLAFVEPARAPVVLQDFVEDSPAALGAPDTLGDGRWAYEDTQAWARAVYEHQPADEGVAGIRYWSRRHRDHGGGRRGINIAVWDTAPPLRAATAPGSVEVSVHQTRIWERIRVACETMGVSPERIDQSACDKCRSRSLPAGSRRGR